MRRQLITLLILIVGLVAAASGRNPSNGKNGTMTVGNNGTLPNGTNGTMSTSNNGTRPNGMNSTMTGGTNNTGSGMNFTMSSGTNSTRSGTNKTPTITRRTGPLYLRAEDFKDFNYLATRPTTTSMGTGARSTGTGARSTGTASQSTGTSSPQSGTNSTSSRLSFGKCSNPSISFTLTGSTNSEKESEADAKNEGEFAPVNQSDFDHGAAPDINTITSFIVDRLETKCEAQAQTVQIAKMAEKAVEGMKAQQAASTWNTMLGVQAGLSATSRRSEKPEAKIGYLRMRKVRRGESYWSE